jgi:DNA primase
MVDADLNPQVVTSVRDAIDIVEVVSDHVKLRRAGRRWQGLCPFHEEKTPSFSVDPERGLFYCFGCHAGGDAIGFVMRLERLEFPEAVERLARRFGVQLPPRSPESRRQHQEAERQRSLLEEAQQWFCEQLTGADAEAARKTLEKRGYDATTWSEYGFGFAPDDWRRLLEHMVRRHTESAVIDAGLAVSKESGSRPYDRFRNRITFPIRASDGRLIAFGGRALGDGEPKYLNSPEGPLFQKRSILFNLDRARRAIGDAGAAIVVEGYFDCLSLHLGGFSNSVATLGTALTPDHARLLRRLAPEVLLCYDADAAGRRAAVTGARVLLETGVEVAMVVLEPGQDPDDLVREQGPEAFRSLLEKPTMLLDFLLAELPADPGQRRRAGVEVAELVGVARDPVTRFGLLEELARRLDLPLEVVSEHARRAGRLQPGQAQAQAPVQRTQVPTGEALLALMLVESSAETRSRISELVEPELLHDDRVRRLLEMAREASQQADEAADLTAWQDDQEVSALLAELSNRPLPEITEQTVATQLRLILDQQAKEKARRLKPLIEAAERAEDLDRVRELQEEQLRLRQKVQGLD